MFTTLSRFWKGRSAQFRHVPNNSTQKAPSRAAGGADARVLARLGALLIDPNPLVERHEINRLCNSAQVYIARECYMWGYGF